MATFGVTENSAPNPNTLVTETLTHWPLKPKHTGHKKFILSRKLFELLTPKGAAFLPVFSS